MSNISNSSESSEILLIIWVVSSLATDILSTLELISWLTWDCSSVAEDIPVISPSILVTPSSIRLKMFESLFASSTDLSISTEFNSINFDQLK